MCNAGMVEVDVACLRIAAITFFRDGQRDQARAIVRQRKHLTQRAHNYRLHPLRPAFDNAIQAVLRHQRIAFRHVALQRDTTDRPVAAGGKHCLFRINRFVRPVEIADAQMDDPDTRIAPFRREHMTFD